MQYKTFGKSQTEVSRIGLGGHREGFDTQSGMARWARFHWTAQQRASIVGRAIDGGVTYFDTTFGCELKSLGESLRILNRRDGLFVSGMRVDFVGNYLGAGKGQSVREFVRSEVEARLQDFGFDYLDQFMIGAVDSDNVLDEPREILDDTLDELDRMRTEGKIGMVGFSCHDADYAARTLEAFPQFESAMTPYNFARRDEQAKLEAALRKSGAAWIAMKAVVWHLYGIPITALRNLGDGARQLGIDPDAPIAELALRFVLANPLLTTAVPSMNSIEAVDENLAAGDAAPLGEAELAQLHAYQNAAEKDDNLPLVVAGLWEKNLRSQGHAVHYACNKLGIERIEIDFEADHAESQCTAAASQLADKLQTMPQWAPLLEGLENPA